MTKHSQGQVVERETTAAGRGRGGAVGESWQAGACAVRTLCRTVCHPLSEQLSPGAFSGGGCTPKTAQDLAYSRTCPQVETPLVPPGSRWLISCSACRQSTTRPQESKHTTACHWAGATDAAWRERGLPKATDTTEACSLSSCTCRWVCAPPASPRAMTAPALVLQDSPGHTGSWEGQLLLTPGHCH